MTKNFFEFYNLFATSETPLAKLTYKDFCKKYSSFSELDCTLVSPQDVLNLILMEEFLGQEEIYIPRLEKELFKKPRTKQLAKIQKSCLETLKKHPKPHHKRDWMLRYQPDPRTPEQQEHEHVTSAIITLERDGIETFLRKVAGNLDIMKNPIKNDTDERTK